jgi:excinuclease ABC subunit C
VGAGFQFDHRIEFLPENSDALLRSIPAAPGVFSLRGAAPAAEPYLTRAADLRRRLRRLLAPPEARNEDGTPVLSKRLNLRERVRFIDYTRTGSDFESSLVLYRAARSAYGPEEARRRLRLHAPYFLRVTMQHAHPRVYATNRLSKKSLAESFGPFPSRAAAERYCDAVLDLFRLRRCHEDLAPFPEHPGCVYGEINKCMAPCKGAANTGGAAAAGGESQAHPQACTPEAYAAEAQQVFAFFATRGESLLTQIAADREAASAAMDFEQAAALHKHWERVHAAALLADELVRPVPNLRALIVQELGKAQQAGHEPVPRGFSLGSHEPATEGASAPERASPDDAPIHHDSAAVFLLANGTITGPEPLSTLGVRAVREQTAVGSSLFAQPLMLAAVPLDEPASSSIIPPDETPSPHAISTEAAALSHVISTEAQRSGEIPALEPANNLSSRPESSQREDAVERPATAAATNTPEDRARATIAALESHTLQPADIAELCDHLSLFRRWYYRPEKQRQGEVFLPNGSPGNTDGEWPIRRLLNGASRVVLGPPAAAPSVDREAAKTLKTKLIHKGREGVEREVPVLPKRGRSRKAVTPDDLVHEP